MFVTVGCNDRKADESVGDTTDAGVATAGDAVDSPGTGDGVNTDRSVAPAMEPIAGGRIVVAGEAEVGNPWTPAEMNCDSFCQMRARTFFDPLMVITPDLKLSPFLLESVEPNKDNTIFTLTVRKGITFHDGTRLDADAVMDNLNRGGHSLTIRYSLTDLARRPNGDLMMEKLDDYTFTIATGLNGDPAKPVSWPVFPYYLARQWGLVASPTWLASIDEGTGDPTEPVGTGPFELVSYAPGDRTIVRKNPDYWHHDADGSPLPYLDEIEFRVIPDSQVRAQALESGEADLIATSDGSVISNYSDTDGYELVLQDNLVETSYVLFHLSKEGPLRSRDVRCALNQAIDKVDMISAVEAGFNDPANGPFSPGQEGYLEDNGLLDYDPAAAAAAIEAYEADHGPVTISYSTTPTATSLAAAEYLQRAWGDIGVDVDINQVEQSKLINDGLFGDPALDTWSKRMHAGLFVDEQFFWWHGSGAHPDGELALNYGRLDDPVINDLLRNARSEADPDVRRAYAENINRRFAEQCWVLPLWYTKWGIIHQPNLHGIGRSPLVDGRGFMRDGAGFPGQVWLTAAFLDE